MITYFAKQMVKLLRDNNVHESYWNNA